MDTLLEGKLKDMIEVRNREVLVVGLGLSGVAAAKFLKRNGASVRCTDSCSGDDLESVRRDLDKLNIPVQLGGHTEEFFADTELVVTSPGVPPWAVPIVLAEERGVPIISELELAWAYCKNPLVAITGTNGKSTAATLLHRVIQNSGMGSRLCGNIGYPLVEQVTEVREDEILVTEVSSFQLERIRDFKPMISIILNITPDHLDRYPSMEEYTAAKLSVLDNQDSVCFAVLNEDLRAQVEEYLEGRPGPQTVFFGRGAGNEITIEAERIIVAIPDFAPFEVLRSDVKYLKGEHNCENIAAVAASAAILGVGAQAIRSVLIEFRGLEHRLEYVAEIDGVSYINDSKATTVDSVCKALDAVGEGIILIAGGRDKGSDFRPLCGPVSEKVRAAVLIGEAASTISDILKPLANIEFADDMRDAVGKASHIADTGDTVLLSPACASFDMFKNFEERGDVFKKEVMTLKHKMHESRKTKEGTL